MRQHSIENAVFHSHKVSLNFAQGLTKNNDLLLAVDHYTRFQYLPTRNKPVKAKKIYTKEQRQFRSLVASKIKECRVKNKIKSSSVMNGLIFIYDERGYHLQLEGLWGINSEDLPVDHWSIIERVKLEGKTLIYGDNRKLFTPEELTIVTDQSILKTHYFKWLLDNDECLATSHKIHDVKEYLRSLGFDLLRHKLNDNVLQHLKFIHEYFYDIKHGKRTA